MLGEVIAAITTGAVAVITALFSLLIARINREKSKTEIAALKETIENAEGVYYVTCPQCGTRIFLTAQSLHRYEEGRGNGTD